jgi:DNA-binding FrmR family transcriptional regulator
MPPSLQYLLGYARGVQVTEAWAQTPLFTGADMTTVHDPERKRALVLRLKRVEGQLRGIQKLLESDADCEKVAQQLAAARKALDKTFFTMVGCVIAQGDLPADDVADMLARFS